MADTKISALTAATAIADADLVTIVQGGVNKKAAASLVADFVYGKRFIETNFVVNAFTDLPSAAANSGKLAYVQTTTGSILTLSRKTRGFYRSDGSNWYEDDLPYRDASTVYFDSTGLTNFNADDIAEALVELDPIISGKAAKSQIGDLQFYTSYVVDQDYPLIINSSFGFTVNEITTKCSSGTATLTGYINGTPLGGTANSVSTSEQTQTHASANTLATGDDFKLVASASSSCVNMIVKVKRTRTLA